MTTPPRQGITDDMLVAGGRAADAANVRWNSYGSLEAIYLAMRSAQPTANVIAIFRKQTELVERLCDAVDRASEDIGGEGALTVLRLLGPVNDEAIAMLAAAQPGQTP